MLEEIEAEERARARSEERSALMNALNAQGITGARATAVAAWLHGEGNRVRRSKEGQIAFVIKRDGYEDELDVSKGVVEWLATDEGKEFAPPRQAGGSGSDAKPRSNGASQHQPVKGARLMEALKGG